MKIMKPKKRLLSVFLVLAVLFSSVFSGAYASGGGALGGGGSTSSGGGSSSVHWSHNYYLDDLMIYNENDEPAEDLQEAAYALCHIDYHLEANVDLYLAAYADDGKLVSIDKHSDFLDFGAGIESTSITVLEMTSPELYINSGDQAVDEIRIFIWDKKMRPLSNVLSSKDSSNIEGDRSVTLELSQIVTDELNENSDGSYSFPDDLSYLEFYDDEAPMGSQKYDLKTSADQTADPDIYINGVLCEDNAAAALSKYIINRHMGEIKLVDLAPADGIWDEIHSEYYITGEISSITPRTGKIFLSDVIGVTEETSFVANNNTKIFKDNEEITISDMMAGDVVSIAYNVNGTLAGSPFYTIYVSRNVVTGILTEIDYAEGIIYFNNQPYCYVGAFERLAGSICVGDSYELYLDAFGMIYQFGLDMSSVKYGIIDKCTYNSADDNYRATIYTAEGEILNLIVDGTRATVAEDGTVLASMNKWAVQTAVRDKVYINGNSANGKQDVKDRVITYEISSSTNAIVYMEFLTYSASSDRSCDQFNDRTGAIGTVKMDEYTRVIDSISYKANDYDSISDLATGSISSFLDDMGYTAFAYGYKNKNGAYPFVVVIEGAKAYTKYTRFAVCASRANPSIDANGDELYKIKVYYNSAINDNLITFYVRDDSSGIDPGMLDTGDIIVFSTDPKGYIADLQKISNWEYGLYSFDSIREHAINNESLINLYDLRYASDEWESTAGIDDAQEINRLIRRDKVTIAFGPIIEAGPNYITLGVINDGKTTNDVTGTYDIFITNETNAYLYDYAKATKVRLEPASAISIPYCPPYADNNDVIDWSAEENESTCFAFVLVSDGEAKDIFVLEPR